MPLFSIIYTAVPLLAPPDFIYLPKKWTQSCKLRYLSCFMHGLGMVGDQLGFATFDTEKMPATFSKSKNIYLSNVKEIRHAVMQRESMVH